MIGFLAFLTSLKDLFMLVKEVVGLYQKARLEGWIEEGKTLAENIKKAQTDEERKALVRHLSKWTSAP